MTVFCSQGDICPLGMYCPPGSHAPLLCPPGTYLNSTGNDDPADCIDCTAGMYCMNTANAVPTGYCDAGWYCSGGQDNPQPTGLNCTLGKCLGIEARRFI